MLQINPYFRIPVDDALNHPCFAKMKKTSREIEAEYAVNIEFEDQKMDKSMLR